MEVHLTLCLDHYRLHIFLYDGHKLYEWFRDVDGYLCGDMKWHDGKFYCGKEKVYTYDEITDVYIKDNITKNSIDVDDDIYDRLFFPKLKNINLVLDEYKNSILIDKNYIREYLKSSLNSNYIAFVKKHNFIQGLILASDNCKSMVDKSSLEFLSELNLIEISFRDCYPELLPVFIKKQNYICDEYCDGDKLEPNKIWFEKMPEFEHPAISQNIINQIIDFSGEYIDILGEPCDVYNTLFCL